VRVGIALNMLSKEGRSDAAVLAEHLALGDLAEPLGFDSLFALKHHFTKTYSKLKDPAFRQKATDFYVKIQVVGTPDECIQQIGALRRLTGRDHLATEFGYGGMPHEDAELNMRMFADRVMPVLQRDRAFFEPSSAAADESVAAGRPAGSLFAPA
jgi:alkanesulfonate monooxygenase SsuD/methylene tetrahydromethanopterin reductase-like flavin-dependent oxidoreductase (luciferase family)